MLDSEYKSVSDSNVYFVVFNESFSVGSVVELMWAIGQNKEIYIFYKKEESEYEIKSDYWFAIATAIKMSNKVTVKSFDDISEVIKFAKESL